MSNKTGGPAFPTTQENHYEEEHSTKGMTLRDYFAAKAMQAEIVGNEGIEVSPNWINQVAELAYQMADAMLNVRGRT